MAITIKGERSFLKKGAASPLGSVPGLSFKGVERQRGPTYGEQWVIYYESAASNDPSKPSPAEAAYRVCPSDFTAKLTAVGPTHQLVISCPVEPNATTGLNETATQYELHSNAEQLDLREHPRALALGPSKISIIDSVLNKDKKSDNSFYSEADLPTDPDAKVLYNLLRQRNGSAAFQVSQYVFRYSVVTNRRAAIDIAYLGVNQVYTTDQMLDETGGTSVLLSAVSDAVKSIPAPTVPLGVGSYKAGWLKSSPTVSIVASNKAQLSGEYVLAYWSLWTYPEYNP